MKNQHVMTRNAVKRFLIEFSYDGSNYYGYQKQKGKKTIQEEIEKALKEINSNKEVKIYSSGRTDKGVHAYSQHAHFDLNIKIDSYHLNRAINSKISNDIYVKNVKQVNSDFHARYMVKTKTYLYKINVGSFNPMEKNYVYQYNKELKFKLMNKAAGLFKGKHDFALFTSKDNNKENKIRNITKVKLIKNKDYIYLYFTSNGFLKYQVRYMVGFLIEIGNKLKTREDLKSMFYINEKPVYKIAPPEGLYLLNVKY